MTISAERATGAAPATAATDDLVAKLSEPGVAASLGVLLDHADLLAVLVQGLDQLVARSEVIGDNVLSSINELRETVSAGDRESGIDIGGLMHAGTSLAAVLPKAAPGMVRAVESGVIDRVLDSDLVTPAALTQVEILARGLTDGSARFDAGNGVQVTGLVSAARLLRDPDIQRALSYVASIGQSIGRQLAQHQNASSSTTAHSA